VTEESGVRESAVLAAGTVDATVIRLFRGGLLNLVGAVTFGTGTFIFFVAAARALPPSETGGLFEVIAFFVMITDLANLGTPVGLVRTLSHARALARLPELRPTVYLALLPVATVAMLLGAGVFIAAPDLATLIARQADSHTVATYLRVIAVFVPFGAVLSAILAATQALGTMVPTNLVENFLQPLLRLVLLSGIALGISTAFYPPLTWTLPTAVGLLVAASLLRSLLGQAEVATDHCEPPRPLRVIAGEFWRFTGFRSLGNLVQVALIWFDIVLVGAVASARDAGIYAAASRYLVAGTLVNTAVINVLSPELSAAFARGQISEATELYRRSTRWLMAITLPVYLLMAVFAPVLMSIFGAGFRSGAHALEILALAMSVSMATGPIMAVLLMGGRSIWNMTDLTAALAVNIGGNILLVPHYGITGAGIAYAASILLINVVPLAQAHRSWRLHPFGTGYLLLVGACLIWFAGLAIGIRVWAGATVTALVAASLIGTVGYLVSVWFLRNAIDLTLPGSLQRQLVFAGRSHRQPQSGSD
jgi:O-antigen/teichoic acid export membrane protein